ncbi:MAG TPA: GGDEF domain-containing protein [Candidatus Bilamarchaeum sp.]|nr:GGDEF domain-containing protein [Candidatus Bilamarchaeum sp.]
MTKKLYPQGNQPVPGEEKPRKAFAGREVLETLAHSGQYSMAIDRITSGMACTDIRELLRMVPECFSGVAKIEITGPDGVTLVSAFVKDDKVIFSGKSDLEEQFVKTSVPLTLKHGGGQRNIGDMHILSFKPLSLDSEHPNDWYESKKVLEIMSTMIAKTMDAKLDGLTALPVRKYFDLTLQEHVEKFRADGTVFSLITLDIDFFKKINDQFGHDAGDRVLAGIARLLHNRIRSRTDCTDRVFRAGGEEFAIILPGIQGVNAYRVAERLREIIRLYDFGLGRPVTCSFGVAEITEVGAVEGADKALYKLADTRMYEAKTGGRNSVVPGERISQMGMKAVKIGNNE